MRRGSRRGAGAAPASTAWTAGTVDRPGCRGCGSSASRCSLALGCIVGRRRPLRAAPSGTSPPSLGIGAAILALVIAPIATELPEKFNSVIWVRQGKDTLALGNITGAMVFQSVHPDRRSCCCSRRPPGRSTSDSALGFASAGIAVRVDGGDLRAAAAAATADRARPAGRGRLLRCVYLGLVARPRTRRRLRRRRPGCPDGRRTRTAPAGPSGQRDPLQEPIVCLPRSTLPAALAAGRGDRADPATLDLPTSRARYVPLAEAQGQHHDPRVHVRHGRLRGDPGLLERRPGPAVRAQASASTIERMRDSCHIMLMDLSRPWTSWSR